MPENSSKRLFLLDAYALIFRAYYAFIKNPRVTSKGMNTSAIFGFLLALEEVIHKQKPTHMAVVFDHPSPTFRHDMYQEYKAKRMDTPEDIKSAVPWIKKLLEAYRIQIIDCPGYEADDIIGTLAIKASQNGYTTYMMTPDKDFAQLVSESIYILKPSRSGVESSIWGVNEIRKEFSISDPVQVIDILALMGDTSDNVPGAPGVGPKTAIKLISEFGSIEELFRNTDKLGGKLREIIETYRGQIEFSKKLVTIEKNVPIAFDEKALLMEEPDSPKLRALFDELEFKALAARILGETDRTGKDVLFKPQPSRQDELQGSLFTEEEIIQSKELKTIQDVEHDYKLIQGDEEIKKFTQTLLSLREFSFKTETSTIDPINAELISISFAWEKGKGYMVSFTGNREESTARLKLLKPAFESPGVLKISQNIKFDIQVLAGYGIDLKGEIFDTMIAHYLIEPEMRHNLNLLSPLFLSYNPIHIESIIGEKGKNQKTLKEATEKELLDYSVEEADVAYQLKKVLEPKIILEGLEDLSRNIEMPLVSVLASMERTGVRLDEGELKTVMGDLRQDILQLEKEIFELAGTEFNISSPKQLGEILFVKMKLDDNAKMTKTKQYITNEEILQKLTRKHPIVEKVLEYRGLKKLLTTYVESLPVLIDRKTGRIHTCFNQAVAATGRLSSNNPNLQNIPVRDERGRQLRKAFVPDEGFLFFSADYSQIELRLLAHLTKDRSMIEDFLSGSDIHSATASKIFGVSINDVTREMRSRAKTANFGISYGISVFGLSERLNIGRKEAKDLIDGYFASYPGVKLYMEETIRATRERGYVKTMFGRRRYVRDIHSRNQVLRGNAERNAINAPIQGSAADIIKIAMVRIFDKLVKGNFRSKMILQVHDELIFEAEVSEFERLKEMVLHEMSNAAKLDVPLMVDWGKGKNWFEAH